MPKVSIAVSNHHVHLTKKIYDLLFDEEISIKRPLNQIGEYASNQTVTLKGPKGIIENVRLVGPLRNYNQVELLRSDANFLGLNPPVRDSGNLENSETITLITNKNEITLENVCIIAEKHIHMTEEKAKELNLKNRDKVIIKYDNKEIDAFVKVTSNGYYEMHIDKDESLYYHLETGDIVTFEKI